MTKEEILSSKPQYSRLSFGLAGGDENEYTTIRGAQEAMDEYAKQQAIEFVKYNCPDLNLDDTLLNAGYAGFLIHQHQEQQNKL